MEYVHLEASNRIALKQIAPWEMHRSPRQSIFQRRSSEFILCLFLAAENGTMQLHETPMSSVPTAAMLSLLDKILS